jgi:CHAT domain-containing protein/tetratricopeptide (TPR) repeat protein
MCDTASERALLRPVLLAVAVMTLLLIGLNSPAARAQNPPERLTAEQRKELERQAGELNNSAFQCYRRWGIAPALEKTNQALQIRERLYPKSKYPDGHPKLAESLNAMGFLLRVQGAYAEARGYFERALAMNQALYPKERYPQGHTELAQILNNLGTLLQDQGAYGEARGYLERALEMLQALYPKARYPLGHPDLAHCLNNLGVLLQAQGTHAEARGYFERALAMNQALYPKERYPQGHPDLASNLNNLGSQLQNQGAYGEARVYFERALAMRRSLYPNDRYPQGHPDLAESLNNLANLLASQGAYGEARSYHERALAMFRALYPKDRYPQGHPSLASSLNGLGTLLEAQGAHGEARGYYERALTMIQGLHPKDQYPRGHPHLAYTLAKLGILMQAEGAYGEARGYYERALAMNKVLYPNERYPQGHVKLAGSLTNLGYLLEAQGLYGEARPFLQQAVDMEQGLAEAVLVATSEAEAMNYLAQLPLTRDALISVCLHVPDSDEANYARVWRGKALVARVFQRRQAELFQRAVTDPAARRDVESWRDVRGQLARLLLATTDDRDHREWLAGLQQLTADQERLERQLSESIPEFARHQSVKRSPHTKLVEALPEHLVVLDLVSFTRIEQDPQVKGRKGERLTPSYIGFVLAKGRPVRAVDLGPVAPIDEAVMTWREAIARRQASPAADTIRRLVWEPLARHFAPDTTTVVFALDGRLTAVPWTALAGDKPGTVLLEQYALATVPHAPFLLDRLIAPAPPTDDRGMLLAVGGVAYDQVPKPVEDEKTKVELLGALPAETSRGRLNGWRELPGTLDELNAVTQFAEPRTVIRLEGAGAGTAQLLRELPRARWAHIATHGFFADPTVPSVLQPDPRLFSSIGRENVGAGMRNPLILSGLVLAGANRPSADVEGSTRDDLGILTAEAIAGLPLQDLELVVLSACETGLGMVGGGEGVFGLQRAFHLAGAHNVVASLWKVDDQATAALMAIFYDQLWRQHKPPIVALRTAQLTLYHHPESIPPLAKARGTPDFGKLVERLESGPGSGQPVGKEHARIDQWAAFVLSGWGQ